MTDLFKAKENEFYIELKEERYYFPGENILGDVILDLKKASKTLNIKVTLEGTVEIGGRSLLLFSKSVFIAESPDGEKSYYLEPHTHRFPFKITIPSSKQYKVPSTLQIGNLLKVKYKLIAIYNKPLYVERLCPITSVDVNILEDINVESSKLMGEQKINKELVLTGETRTVKVSTLVGKRAAVKGDIIPISITIEHIGVFVRDKAISVQLLRSVYYGKNTNELFGPKCIKEVTSNIDISGPTSFTKTFNIQLPIPSNVCPTVDKSGHSFKIDYTMRISVNLNEQNPLQVETQSDIVIFNIPFTIGTYPRLAFSIDDDDYDTSLNDQKEDEIADYEQIAEKMKELDLEELSNSAPEIIQQDEESANMKTSINPHLHHKSTITRIDPTLSSPTKASEEVESIKSSTSSTYKPNQSLSSASATNPSYNIEIISPPTDKLYNIPQLAETNPQQTEKESKNDTASPVINNQTSPMTNLPANNNTTTTTTTISSEQSSNYYNSNLKLSPSEIYNDYQPIVSPTAPTHADLQRNESLHRTASSYHGQQLGRRESVRWIVRNQDVPTPAAVSSPIIIPSSFPTTCPVMNNGVSMPNVINQATTNIPMPQPSYPLPFYNNSPMLPIPQQQSFSPYTYTNHYPQQTPLFPDNNTMMEFPCPQPHFAGGFMPPPPPPSNQLSSSPPPPLPLPSPYPIYYYPN